MDRLTYRGHDGRAYEATNGGGKKELGGNFGGKFSDRINSLIKDKNKLIDRLALYEDTGLEPDEIPQWIPCSKRLPECSADGDNSSKDLLIAVKYKTDKTYEHPFICCGYLLDGEWWSYTEHSCHPIDDTVVAWMPLPQPPKGENPC